jgi:hypothetical protein
VAPAMAAPPSASAANAASAAMMRFSFVVISYSLLVVDRWEKPTTPL